MNSTQIAGDNDQNELNKLSNEERTMYLTQHVLLYSHGKSQHAKLICSNVMELDVR